MISVRRCIPGNGTSFRQDKNVLRPGCFVSGLLLTLLIALATPLCVHAVSPLQGDLIINVVDVTSSNTPAVSASCIVRTVIRTPATIEYLQYAPSLPGANLVPVVTGSYLSSANPAVPSSQKSPPTMAGASTPVDLTNPIPLSPLLQLHQGNPLFIRVTDPDQNLDRTVRETVFVTVTDPDSGDTEVVILTETGPDTGVFVGYIPTSATPTAPFSGSLTVNSGNTISTRYVDIVDRSDTALTTIMVDPYGIAFDSNTGNPVNGALITLIDNATGLPAAVFGDDGISSYPATLTTGSSVSDSSGRTYSFPSGGYRFPFVLPGSYRFLITPPGDYTAPSSVATAILQALPGAPFAIVTGSRAEQFPLNPGPALRIDVPLDPVAKELWVTKTAGRDLVAPGEFITFDLSVTNVSRTLPARDVRLVDAMPPGFRLRRGSVTVNGAAAPDPYVSADGKTAIFSVGTLAPEAVYAVRFVAEITAGAAIGTTTNLGYASAAGGVSSNIARAVVRVRDDLLRTRSILMGRVTQGGCPENGDEAQDGLEGVRVYLEDGSFVISDKQGLFHLEGIKPGLHVVQMDLDSLPEGYVAVSCTENSRSAGRAFSQFVELQGGTLWRVDFYTKNKNTAPEHPASDQKQSAPAAVSAEMAAPDTPPAPAAASAPAGAAPTGQSPPVAPSPAAAATLPAASAGKSKGLLGLSDGDTLLERINTVRVRLDSSLALKLLVDGVEISPDRIAFRAKEPASDTTLYSFAGIDFGDPGTHTVEIRGADPFGNARFSQKATVIRTGEIARITVTEVGGNVADGVTPVRIRVELFDAAGYRLKGTARLQVKGGTLQPFVKDREKLTLDDQTAGRVAEVDKDGWIQFQPVTSSGSYNTILAYTTVNADADVYVTPKLRDWILVGLAEGTLGYNTVSGNMESLKAGEAKEDFYQDGRIAFYAKGQIKGEWLLTMSYDTAKSSQAGTAGLFQQIDPDSYYTLYGDSGQQQYDAASSKRLYIKVERAQFYAMFGDFDSGLSLTELSRYSRRMTGVKTEFQSRHIEASGFAAESTQVYQRDEIPGDGSSGLYRLRRHPLLINSEKITIVARDRFRSELIISSRTLSRFIDYAIDYDAGTILFRQPVMSKDENFNPVTIVAEYEALAAVGRDYTYGGRVGLKLFDKRLKVGATHIHEGLGENKNELFGVDTTLLITDSTKLRAEAAETQSDAAGAKTRGYSYLAELTHVSKKFDVKAYLREQQGNFGLGQQMGSESATRKFGLEGSYRLNESFSSSASLYRQSNLAVSTERDVAEGKVTYATKKYSTSLGLLHAQDRLADGSSMSSGQITASGKLLTLKDKLTLTVDHAQSVWGNSNADFPTRTMFGAEYKINEKVALLGGQEFTWGKTATTNATRFGVRSTPWKGGTFTTSVERQLNENSSRVFGSMGLRQTWHLTEEWKVDTGLDRSQTILKKSSYTLNPVVPAASSGSEDFTAVSAGATYLVKGLTWDSRFEYRTSASEDKWGVVSGVVKEQGDGWAWSARGQYFQTAAAGGLETRRANIRLGLVYRPPQTRWIHLNRFDMIHENQAGGGQSDMTSWRLVNNYSANYKPRKHLQVSLKYGAKFVMDTISGRRYQAYTDHAGFEMRYDLTSKWDIGLRGSVLHSWNGGQLAYSAGASSGYNVVDNAWVSLGYNVWGFSDKDFSAADYTAQGPYVRFRIKFDQQSVKDAAGWLNKQ